LEGVFVKYSVSAILRNFSDIKKAAFPLRSLQRIRSTNSYKNPIEVISIPLSPPEIKAYSQKFPDPAGIQVRSTPLLSASVEANHSRPNEPSRKAFKMRLREESFRLRRAFASI
jgi:hypothetical protein